MRVPDVSLTLPTHFTIVSLRSCACWSIFDSLVDDIHLFCTVTSGQSSFVGRSLSFTADHATSPQTASKSQLDMMRHRHGFNKLSKPADQRKALLRALTTEVIRHGRIKTTLIRAKAVRKHVDHMIELGKRGDLHARRQALGWIYDKNLVHSLFEAAPDRYGEQNGGYTRVLRTVARQGDNAKMAILELV
jgi:large subunit ribosomal protein L17